MSISAAKCTCPKVYTAIGQQRSSWSADCPVHGKSVVGVFGDDGLSGVMFQAEANAVGPSLFQQSVLTDTSYPPTAAEQNALPANLRKWIHELETDADPAGTIRRCVLLEDENAQLRAALAERDDARNAADAKLCEFREEAHAYLRADQSTPGWQHTETAYRNLLWSFIHAIDAATAEQKATS